MTDFQHDLLFGFFPTPDASQPEHVLDLARLADTAELDLFGIQDHPYQPRFLDMWTLLSVIAGQTQRIRLLPDVVNLPLRPPALLARAAASLDILSGGRLELGLGSGAAVDAAKTMGAPRREPGVAVDALAEAIGVLRALWTPGPQVHLEGEHYPLLGAQPGPIPPHSINIWVGAYKPRMLRLTGQLADGWLPSSPMAPPAQLAEMSRRVDDAAVAAGRHPAMIRRVYNIVGRFTSAEGGFLVGPPRVWAEQLADLVLTHGFSGFVLAAGQSPANDLRRFADEVTPAVREAVARARRGGPQAAITPPQIVAPASTLAPGVAQLAQSAPISVLLDEALRPHRSRAANPNGHAPTPSGRISQQTLIAAHEMLRSELSEIRDVANQVALGELDPAAARSHLNRMTLRQNYWTLGAFCAQYCRVVTIHHTIEDQSMFPGLRREQATLAPVLERLSVEHEVIAEVIDRFDESLAAMIEQPAGIVAVRRVAQELSDALLSHLAYEEDELLEPLGSSNLSV